MGARKELSLRRNKGQSVDTVMKWVDLHLGTPEDHHQEALRKHGWVMHMYRRTGKSDEYVILDCIN